MCFSAAAREGAFQNVSRKRALLRRSMAMVIDLVAIRYQVAIDITSMIPRMILPTMSVCARKLAKPAVCCGSMGSTFESERNRDQHPGRDRLGAAAGGDEPPRPR